MEGKPVNGAPFAPLKRPPAYLQVSERIRAGTVFLPMHWGAAQADPCEANRLMHELGCPLSGQPELKAAAVRLEPGQHG